MPTTNEIPTEVECRPNRRRFLNAMTRDGQPKPTRPHLLTRDEETSLIDRAQAGDDGAMAELVKRNAGLVFQLAQKVAHPVNYLLEDAVQDGSLGFITAVKKFRTSSGNKLSTYATHWIMQALGRGKHRTEDLIRLPSHIKDLQGKLRRVRASFLNEMDREPTAEEVARKAGMTAKQVQFIADVPNGWISLDTPVPLDGGRTDTTFLVDFIADPIPGPESDVKLEEFNLKQVVAGIFALADPMTRELLQRRFGFPPYDAPQTFDEIGKAMGVTRQCIQLREKKALHQLRFRLGMSQELMESNRGTEDRNRAIVAAVRGGEAIQTVALRFNVQARRVRQIVKQSETDNGTNPF